MMTREAAVVNTVKTTIDVEAEDMARLTSVVLVLVLFAAACGGGGGSGGDGLVTSSLASLPQLDSGGEFVQISVSDFRAATNLVAGESASTADQFADILARRSVKDGGLGFVFGGPEIVLSGFLFASEELDDFVGFELEDIDRTAEAIVPPERVSLIVGPGGWGGEAEAYEGDLVTFGQGDDGEIRPAERSALDSLGRPMRAAERDGELLATLSTPLAQGWLDGSAESYADDEEFMSIAVELDKHDVISAILFAGELGQATATAQDLGTRSEPFISEPFSALGIGGTIRDGRAIEVMSYRFASDASAESAIPSLEDAWTTAVLSGGARITDVAELNTIEQSGSVVTVVVLVPDGTVGFARDMAFRRDPPLAFLQ